VADAMKRDARVCPDPETIAAFIDGRLGGAERAQVIEHLADCADCYFVFSESVRSTGAQTTAEPLHPVRPWFRNNRILGLAAAAALVVAVIPAYMRSRSSSAQQELQALVAAVGTDRTVEPRLTGGFAYGPLRGALRGEASTAPLSPDVRIAAAEIEKAATSSRTPEALRALGISYLVTGDIARAVQTLEEATSGASPDARALTDLSAAYLVRGARMNQPQDFAKARTMADRAVKLNPGLAEAWFNRADAMESLRLSIEARDAWREYLKVDAVSDWANEARQRLQRLEAEVP